MAEIVFKNILNQNFKKKFKNSFEELLKLSGHLSKILFLNLSSHAQSPNSHPFPHPKTNIKAYKNYISANSFRL